jgi:hypothetical protein
MRTATVGIGGRRLLAILTALAVMTSLVLVVTTPAMAHTPTVGEDCYGWSVDLKFYASGGEDPDKDNSLKIWIDGNLVVDIEDFGTNEFASGTWDPTKDHTIVVEVRAWDDPDLNDNKIWSFDYQGASSACEEEEETTTTTLPPTTTTTVPPTTTTTVPETTTTTVPDTTTTLPTRWACDDPTDTAVEVGPNDPGYDGAYETMEEALNDEDCVEVEGTVVTTVPTTVSDEELPFTGADSGMLAGLALVLLGAGALLLTITRGLKEN